MKKHLLVFALASTSIIYSCVTKRERVDSVASTSLEVTSPSTATDTAAGITASEGILTFSNPNAVVLAPANYSFKTTLTKGSVVVTFGGRKRSTHTDEVLGKLTISKSGIQSGGISNIGNFADTKTYASYYGILPNGERFYFSGQAAQ